MGDGTVILKLQGTLFSCQLLIWSLGRETQAVAGFSGEVVVGCQVCTVVQCLGPVVHFFF